MKKPLVSVITPAYNSADFLEECIGSVLEQDYPYVEHVVQDGASGDGTLKILKEYIDRVDWISEPDKGQADGLNNAIRRSRGDILIVLNADDMLLPQAAAWGVKQMKAHPEAAVVYGDVLLVDEDGKEIGQFLAPEYDFPGIFCVEKVIAAQAAFIRRSMLEEAGLGADPSLDTCPDYEMFVRLGLKFPMRHATGFISRYRYSRRPMDGPAPRSVERFVRAKSSVMERVFQDPSTPREILPIAKAGKGRAEPLGEPGNAGHARHPRRMAILRESPLGISNSGLDGRKSNSCLFELEGRASSAQACFLFAQFRPGGVRGGRPGAANPRIFVVVHRRGWFPEFLREHRKFLPEITCRIFLENLHCSANSIGGRTLSTYIFPAARIDPPVNGNCLSGSMDNTFRRNIRGAGYFSTLGHRL